MIGTPREFPNQDTMFRGSDLLSGKPFLGVPCHLRSRTPRLTNGTCLPMSSLKIQPGKGGLKINTPNLIQGVLVVCTLVNIVGVRAQQPCCLKAFPITILTIGLCMAM